MAFHLQNQGRRTPVSALHECCCFVSIWVRYAFEFAFDRELQMKTSKPTLLGIPFDANSSYLRGPADAPPLIRQAFHCDSSNSSTESGIELGSESVLDTGDLKLPPDGAFIAVEKAVDELLDKGQAPVC